MELTSKQRAQLRGLASTLDTIIHIGKDGISDNLIKQADDALEARELIKGKVLENSLLTAREAALLLPARSEFAAVWRYLTARGQSRPLQEDFGCLSRKIARASGLPCSPGKLRICLDVFRERGLLTYESSHGRIRIALSKPIGKVDLDRSPIIIKLKQQKDGV